MTAHPTPDLLALIALGEDVEPEYRAHVSECRACFAEIEALQQVVAVGRSLGPEDRLASPPPHVWQRITAELDGQVVPMRSSVDLLERPVPPRDGAASSNAGTDDLLAARRRRAPRRWTTVAVAAATALVVGLAGGFLLKGLTGSQDEAGVAASTQLNALPAWPGANGTATVENGSDGQRTLVVSMNLPATVAVDGTLEVWMSDTRAQDMLSMGTMTGSTGRFPIPASTDVTAHPIVDVSLEPQNDANPAHSDTSVVRGRLNV